MAYVGSRRWSDVDAGDEHFFKLIDIRFSPFRNGFGDDDEGVEFGARGRSDKGYCGSSSSASRQEYLRSYTFCREDPAMSKPTVRERMKSRLKAAAWAVVAWSPYSLPRRVRSIKGKLALRALCSSSSQQRPQCRVPRFLQPCFVA